MKPTALRAARAPARRSKAIPPRIQRAFNMRPKTKAQREDLYRKAQDLKRKLDTEERPASSKAMKQARKQIRNLQTKITAPDYILKAGEAKSRVKVHKKNVYIFYNRKTNQVVYSLHQDLFAHHRKEELKMRLLAKDPRQLPSFKDRQELWTEGEKNVYSQLPFFGKQTVPGDLRVDLWSPLATVHFSTEHQAQEMYRKLREYQLLRAYTWKLQFPWAKTADPHQRKRWLLDQKASVVAHLADALKRDRAEYESVEKNLLNYQLEQKEWALAQSSFSLTFLKTYRSMKPKQVREKMHALRIEKRDLIPKLKRYLTRKDAEKRIPEIDEELRLWDSIQSISTLSFHRAVRTRGIDDLQEREQGTYLITPDFIKKYDNGRIIFQTLLDNYRYGLTQNLVAISWPAIEKNCQNFAESWPSNVRHLDIKKVSGKARSGFRGSLAATSTSFGDLMNRGMLDAEAPSKEGAKDQDAKGKSVVADVEAGNATVPKTDGSILARVKLLLYGNQAKTATPTLA